MKSSASNPDLWRQRYETLREHATHGGGMLAGPPLGLHLLRWHGLAGWMARWNQVIESADIAAAPLAIVPAASAFVRQEQLTVVLAQMAFAQLHTPIKS